jgi:hypothetical protein
MKLNVKSAMKQEGKIKTNTFISFSHLFLYDFFKNNFETNRNVD